jgi:hypothetical protein
MIGVPGPLLRCGWAGGRPSIQDGLAKGDHQSRDGTLGSGLTMVRHIRHQCLPLPVQVVFVAVQRLLEVAGEVVHRP